MDRVRPTSPQQVSMMLSSDFMLPALATPSRLGAPPEPMVAPEAACPASSMASIMALRVSSSPGHSCSARSYLREMGRKIWVATWRAWLGPTCSFLGSSSLIIASSPWSGSGWWRGGRRSQDHHALGDTHCAQVAVPTLDGVFLGEAVAAEQLDAVEA